MRKPTIGVALAGSILLAGCNRSPDRPPAGAPPNAAAASADTAAAPAGISLAAMAGRWHLRSVTERGDTTLVSYDLVATPDTSGWTFLVSGRPPAPVRVVVAGDSILTEAGPYESVLRKGVQVTLNGALRLEGDSLVGTTVAHFSRGGPDSVLRVRTVGTRAK